MSNENIVAYLDASLKVLSSNGAALPNASIGQAVAASYDVINDGAGYPDAMFVLTCQFATAPISGSAVSLYAQPLGIDGSNNAQVPETDRPTVFVGTFYVNDVTTAQSIALIAFDLPRKANYYLHNNGTGQQMASSWTLKVTPRTFKLQA